MELTKEEKEIEKINSMSHVEMCRMWRFASAGHPYFDMTKPFHKVFEERLFKHFGGFTPEISKEIGY